MPGLLNAVELTAMRDMAERMLPSLCTIQAPTFAANGMGEETPTFANTYTLIPCKLSASNSQGQGRYGAQFQVIGEWVLSVAFDQAIASGNRVIFGGDTFEVLRVQDDHDFRILRRAELRRVD